MKLQHANLAFTCALKNQVTSFINACYLKPRPNEEHDITIKVFNQLGSKLISNTNNDPIRVDCLTKQHYRF
jgi:hypothetical protein